MTVKWTPPVSDGGAEITGYVVQQKEKHALRWTPVNEVPVTATSYKVTGLVQKNEYEFRVVAANKAGFGTPSDSSGVVLAKPPYGKKITVAPKTTIWVLALDPFVDLSDLLTRVVILAKVTPMTLGYYTLCSL